MNFFLRTTIFSLVLGFFALISPLNAQAQSCENVKCDSNSDNYLTCLNEKQICLDAKIEETKKEASTLKSAINIFDGQISVLQLQIDQNVYQINKLEKEINELGDRIDGLNLSLDKLSSIMVERVGEHYKRNYDSPVVLFFAQDKFAKLVSEYKSLSLAKKQTLEAMEKAESLRLNYDEQKQTKETKQLELEKKKKDLDGKKRELAQQRSSKENLLQQTKNNEKLYQNLLAEAKAEVAKLKSFTASKAGGVLSAQNSPDGWYFSQRDERWANYRIGNSSEIIYDVGCLVSSVAMIRKKFGDDVTPITIASNNSLFFSNTANMMLSNPSWSAPSGYHYEHSSYSQSKLDQELEKNPVIVKLLAGSYGTHFIVIKEKKDGKYIIHDPWEGYDKNFSDFYSTSQISRISYLVK